MGYTHYWYRDKEIPQEKFSAIVEDFAMLLPVFAENGVKLAGGLGEGLPEVNDKEVWFNGSENCGHPMNHSIVMPWPAKGAGGVGDSETADVGTWYAGAKIITRCCDGDCSYETFNFPQKMELKGWQEPDNENRKYFNCCKTAFRPYDLAVTAFLVIAKHHLGDSIIVRSDGEEEHWFDAKLLCQLNLDYGVSFKLDYDVLVK